MRTLPLFTFLSLGLLCSCAYMGSLAKQNKLQALQKHNPSQYAEKHIIERDYFFVYGKLTGGLKKSDQVDIAVAALSSEFEREELVDVNYLGKVNSYYGLNLPKGGYRLVVLADQNADGKFSDSEVIGEKQLSVNTQSFPEGVARDINIAILAKPVALGKKLTLPSPQHNATKQSLFFPKGTLRSLDDPIFSSHMASLGLYDPNLFMESAPTLFYALEEDTIQKIPVIFVHGIGGSVTQFSDIVNSLDTERYKPWFFYYPSGVDLNNTAAMFYDIFLSGKLIEKGLARPIIIAHSMGGLVVREALNLYQNIPKEIHPAQFISIASPFGGMASAQSGVNRAPLVLPAWHDLTPQGEFIQELFRKPLPETTQHYLLYAYLNADTPEDNDGVVPLLSQRCDAVKVATTEQYGFNASHTDILQNPDALATLSSLMGKVESPFPDEHLRYFAMGGFEVTLSKHYSNEEKYIIHSMGKYLKALANANLRPIAINRDFLAVVEGSQKAKSPFETAWVKFAEDFPELVRDTE